MSAPRVSILMPAYNAERYLDRAIASMRRQTFEDFEFLIVDDGSTDGTLGIIEAHARQDARIRHVSRPNTGYVQALNEMIGRARGEYLARMDADDVARSERLARQVAVLDACPDVVAIGTAACFVDPSGNPMAEARHPTQHEDIDRHNLRGDEGTALFHPSVTMRSAAVRALGGYRKDFWPAEDLDLWLRLAEIGRLANLEDVLIDYRFHLQSTGHLHLVRQREATHRVVQAAAQRRGLPPPPPLPAAEAAAEQGDAAHHHRRWAWWALHSGFTSTARRNALRAVWHAPFRASSWRVLFCSLRGR